MSNNEHNIENMNFDTFINAVGSEIEEAQVRLIVAANAQMLFHYWKVGNYILYYQNLHGWGSKTIKKLAKAIRFNYPKKKGYSVRNLAYMCQFARSYPLSTLQNLIQTDARLIVPSVQKITDEVQNLNNALFMQEPLAQIQSSDNKEVVIMQDPLAQIQNVNQTVSAIFQIDKVCFVCTGNACRSPFAECVTKELLKSKGIQGVEVCSRGTLNWGNNPRDTAMADVAREMGYSLSGTTTPITRENLQEADLIVVFEPAHRNAVTKVLDYEYWNRIVLFNTLAFGTDDAVEDPNFQTASVYRRVAEHIETGCMNIISAWEQHPPHSSK